MKQQKTSHIAMLSIILLAGALTTAHADPVVYKIDGAHSDVSFRAQHLLSRVRGQFRDFSGTVTIDPDKRDSVVVKGAIEVTSIDTDEPDRDTHLKSADFFDVARFPQITFEAGELREVSADRKKGKLAGTLSMHGVSRPIVLDVEWMGTATDPWGNRKAAFTGTTTLNRKDYGIVWNKALDAGGFLVGDLVEIELTIEADEPSADSPE